MLITQVTGSMLRCASRFGLMMRYERRAAASLSPKARRQLRVHSLATAREVTMGFCNSLFRSRITSDTRTPVHIAV